MSFLQKAKDKVRKEVDAYKYNKQLENDPSVVRNSLNIERQNVRNEISRMKEIKQFEVDKQELKDLRNQTGLRGKISNGLGALRSHLDNVKARNNNVNGSVKSGVVKATKNKGSLNMFEIQGSGMHNNSSPKGSKSLILQDPKKKKVKGVFG